MGSRCVATGIAVAVAACGGSTLSPPAGGVDAGIDARGGVDAGPPEVDAGAADAPFDAPPPYLACMNDTGVVAASLKACQSDAQCEIVKEQTDCCGTILYVGINGASAAAYGACQASWLAHFPACGCASAQTNTEDGVMSYPWSDAAAPQVRCKVTSLGSLCMTYTP
jgi:hypothetical protein